MDLRNRYADQVDAARGTYDRQLARIAKSAAAFRPGQ